MTFFERPFLLGSFRRSFKIFLDLDLVRDVLNMCMGNDVPRSLSQDCVDIQLFNSFIGTGRLVSVSTAMP